MRAFLIAGACLVLGACGTANLSPAEAGRLSDAQLCRQMALWRNYQGTIYESTLGSFPMEAYNEIGRRHPEWTAVALYKLSGLPPNGAIMDEVRCLWGNPRDTISTSYRGLYTADWIYGGQWRGSFLGFAPTAAVHFDNGKVVGNSMF